MGQKVNPIGLRLQINRTWDSRWFADRNYADLLIKDLEVKKYVHATLKSAGISNVKIERAASNVTVTISAGRPGMIIGKKGGDIEKLRNTLSKMMGTGVALNIVEIRKPEIDAQLVAEGVCQQLERRISFRRAMKRAVQNALRMGSLGIRINVSGRLGGADIARTEWYREGRVPLHTLRADIDYGFAEALTTYGIIGVKVWLYKGDVMAHDPQGHDKLLNNMQNQGGGERRPGNRN